MGKTSSLLLGFLLLTTAAATAQEPTLVVENGRVVVGDGTVLERGSVVVAGERIVEVTDEPVEAPGARRIDASGTTVLPGLVDTHVHLLLGDLYSVPRSTAELDAWIEENLPARLRGFLEAGITTVMSTGDFWPRIREIRERVRSGELLGPRILTSGPVFTAPGGTPAATVCGSFGETGEGNPWCRKHIAVEVATRRNARVAVEQLAAEGVDLIKMAYDSISPPDTEHLETEVMREIVSAAHDHGLRAYAHINEVADALTAVEAGLDGLVHTPFVTASEAGREELAETLDGAGVAAATTAVTVESLRDRFARQGNDELAGRFAGNLQKRLRTIRRIAEADASLVVLGTDTPWLPPAEGFHGEIQLLAEAGLTRPEILQAATRNAAVFMDRVEDLGVLEAGKLADLIVVDGNPMEDMSTLWNVDMVVKGGKVVVGGSTTTTEAPAETGVRREEITFDSGDLRLAGTLTLPAGPGPHPGVVLIPGGGPRAYDRDYNRPGGFRPFRLMADHLAEHGMASLRYDERGVGESEGESSPDLTSADYADDARAALAYLRGRDEIDGVRIGLIGHSEGAHIASLIATSSEDVGFLVLLGAVARSPEHNILEQAGRPTRRGGWGDGDERWVARRGELDRRAFEAGSEAVLTDELAADSRAYYRDLQEVLEPGASAGWLRETDPPRLAENRVASFTSEWVQQWLVSDPPELLRRLDVPVLALYGGLDLQVPAGRNAAPMWEALRAAPAGPVQVHTFPQANHFFRPARTGALHEAAELEPQFVEGFLELVTDWIGRRRIRASRKR